LHEAHRLSQVHATPEPPPPGVEPPLSYWQSAAATFRNEASLHIKDLENIRAARALLACSDPQCMADLDALERQARGWLQAINADLPQVNAGAGTNIPPFQAPY